MQNQVRWDVSIPAKEKEAVARLLEENSPFIHVSPFTTLDAKELAPDLLIGILDHLRQTRPQDKIVLTCAPNTREKNKLEVLLPRLKNSRGNVLPEISAPSKPAP